MTYGCHNRAPLRDSVMVQNGWAYSGDGRTALMVTLPDPMSKNCQHTLDAPNDPSCAGCRWAKGAA